MIERTFIGRTLKSLVTAMAHALEAEELAKKPGLLQRFDPRVKLIGVVGLVVAAVVSRRLSVIVAIFFFALLVGLFSYIPLAVLAKRVWLGIFLFTAAIAAPALFTTPGHVVWQASSLTITQQGLRSAAYLLTRTETAATLAILLVLSTPWNELLKALRSIGAPATLVSILAMTHRYIYLLLETARDMFESRQSRTVGVLNGAQRRRTATRTAGVLMDKSLQLSNDVYAAMLSRGFTGEVRTLAQLKLQATDYVALGALLAATAAALWAGR